MMMTVMTVAMVMTVVMVMTVTVVTVQAVIIFIDGDDGNRSRVLMMATAVSLCHGIVAMFLERN